MQNKRAILVQQFSNAPPENFIRWYYKQNRRPTKKYPEKQCWHTIFLWGLMCLPISQYYLLYHIIIIHRDSGFMMLLITLLIAYISLYNLLFKSCRFAPLGLRKTESQRSTRQINLSGELACSSEYVV